MNFRSKLFYVYLLSAIIYAATFLLPRKIATLPLLPPGQYRLLSLSVFIPTIAIWYAAFYGYAKLRRYSKLIAKSPDGKQVSKIATGLLIVAIGMPVNSISGGLVSNLVQHQPEFAALATIIRNYLILALPLLGFLFVSHGAYGLGLLAKHRPRLRATHALALVYVVVSVLYCYVITTSRDLQAVYHLPAWLVIFTIVAPYLYTWYIGVLAAYEIHLYSRNAPGTLYRRTWNMLALGIGAIIVMQMVTQYITTFTSQIQSLQLLRLYIIVYVLLASVSVGYLLVAIGAKRLQKIEEV